MFTAFTINRELSKISLRNIKKFQMKGFISSLRQSSSFKTREISIPTTQGKIAGVLWEPSITIDSYPESASSKVPVICLHGVQDNCGSFECLIPLLMKENPRVYFAMDLPGHGHSYHTKGLQYDFMESFFALQKIFQYFQWSKAVFLGHSFGSIISFFYTSAFPEMVDKYIALDNMRPVPSDNLGVAYRRLIQSIMKTQDIIQAGKERPSYTYSKILEKVITSRNNTVTKEGCEILLKRGAEQIPGTDRFRFTHDVRLNVPRPFKLFSTEQSSIMSKAMKCPICVIKGDPGDDYEPREDFVKAVEDINLTNPSPVEYHTVPGTHHFHLNTPNLVAPIINKFLSL